jgi:Na+/melibiose symporter-like transporter
LRKFTFTKKNIFWISIIGTAGLMFQTGGVIYDFLSYSVESYTYKNLIFSLIVSVVIIPAAKSFIHPLEKRLILYLGIGILMLGFASLIFILSQQLILSRAFDIIALFFFFLAVICSWARFTLLIKS